MLDVKVLLKVRKEAIESIKKDSEGEFIGKWYNRIFFYILWYILPLIGVSVVIYKGIKLTNLENYIGASIALFTGLFFSLLLSLGDKLRTEKANVNVDTNNYNKFKENMRQISRITQFIILKGILIFVLLLINSLVKTSDYLCVENILTAIAIYILIQYTISIGFLLQRFHHTMKDELNNTI
ncbi:MAG: hypothetical protein K0R65_863 [Crocinitomicaceae bacterium]|jgi:uncharacterized membrane protein|nr:hypothetical protein [Crocinitomicaceae bacterium]